MVVFYQQACLLLVFVLIGSFVEYFFKMMIIFVDKMEAEN